MGGHYFYALLILEPSLIHYCIAWFLLLKVFSKVVEHPSNLWFVDLVGHTLTLPRQVIGYTLTLENEKGEVYTYNLMGTTLQLPQDLSGEYEITIFYGNCKYQGIIEFN